MMKYTTIDTVFTKIVRDLGIENVPEADIIEWTGEALEGINAIREKEEALAFLTVSNWSATLPSGLHNIIQIAKNTLIEDPSSYTAEPSAEDEKFSDSDTDIPVCLDCQGMPYYDYDIAYYRPYFDLQYEYYGWMGKPSYQRMYEPVRLTNHAFFNTIVCKESNFEGLYDNTRWEYGISMGKVLRFNFEKGLVALSYLRTPTDKDGIPMIPDDYSFLTAIQKYIGMKYLEREFYTGKKGSERRAQLAKQDWAWYCKQASNKAMMPQGIDEYENLKDQRLYFIPRRNVYQNFFGNLNQKEVKNVMHTRLRNNIYAGRYTSRLSS